MSNNAFEDSEIETMKAVIEFYGDKSPNWLSDLTHSEQPWIIARGNCSEGMYCNRIIKKDDMREYYSGLQ